ncbi:MAG: Global cell cycle regulator GcrA [Rhizobium sp.]|nr:Global cell cycle regulator GcrA [Rhizobium sp.]
MSVSWKDEYRAELKRLYEIGISSSQIAVRINEQFGTAFTRNAVIGRAHRDKLCGKPRSKRLKPTSPRPPRATAAPQNRLRERYSAESGRMMTVIENVAPVVLRDAEVGSLRVDFWGLTKLNCHFPDKEGDPSVGVAHTFCGCAAVPGLSYCDPHARIAYLHYGRSSDEKEMLRIRGVRVARERRRESMVAA